MKEYNVILRDGDGQPLTDWNAWGAAEMRECIRTAREDWAHYPVLHFIVKDESGTVVIDRTYRSKVTA